MIFQVETNLACHRLLNFQNEYIRLLYIIKRNTDESGAVDLKSVLRYTLSRVETAAKETVDIGDKEAVLQLAALLEALPAHYFQSRKKIEVNCDTGKTDEKIIELLKWYDHCFMVRNDEGSANCISKIVTIQTAEMSEGYRVFLDLISTGTLASFISMINNGLPRHCGWGETDRRTRYSVSVLPGAKGRLPVSSQGEDRKSVV